MHHHENQTGSEEIKTIRDVDLGKIPNNGVAVLHLLDDCLQPLQAPPQHGHLAPVGIKLQRGGLTNASGTACTHGREASPLVPEPWSCRGSWGGQLMYDHMHLALGK